MKFDAVVGNPPYQEEVGEEGSRVMPLYQKFIEKSIEISKKYIIMIVPTRWYNSTTNPNIQNLSNIMLRSGWMTDLVDFDYSLKVFDDADIAGGVCYFKLDKDNNSTIINFENRLQDKKYRKDISKYDILIRDEIACGIIDKVISNENQFICDKILGRSAFGIENTQTGKESRDDGDLVLISKNNTKSYISASKVTRNSEIVDKYKVYTSYLGVDVNIKDVSNNHKVYGIVDIASPGEVSTETYIIMRSTDDLQTALNFKSYITTKFVRFLILNTAASMHLTRNMYMFVPEQDFNKEWTDEELYNKYKLTEDEINYIEYKIRKWVDKSEV